MLTPSYKQIDDLQEELVRLRESRDQLLAAARGTLATWDGAFDDRCEIIDLFELRAAIAKAEELAP